MTLADATKDALDVIARAARGEDPQAERIEQRAAPTFGELATAYLEADARCRLRSRALAEVERIIRHDLLPAWDLRPAAEIRRRDVAAVLDRILARGAPVQANRTRAWAHRIFAFALEREIVEFNPVAGLRRPTQEHSRQRVLTEDEIRALWAVWEAEKSVTSALFRMILVTAQRRQEIAAMRWLDLAGSWWTIPAGVVKNKLAHRVHLSRQARALLEEIRPATGRAQHVFASPRRPGGPLGWVNKAKERYQADSGVADWTPHDLRRTAATYMGRLGISRAVIARVLNHAERGVTAIYDRSTGEYEVEQALILWGARLEQILQGTELQERVVLFVKPSR